MPPLPRSRSRSRKRLKQNQAQAQREASPSPVPVSDPAVPTEGRCHLLEVPLAVRDRIYESALLLNEGEPELITKENFAQPALLCTCRRIRFEASPVFYIINNFMFRLPNFDISMWRAHRTQALKALEVAGSDNVDEILDYNYSRTLLAGDALHWYNVLEYLEWFHEEETERIACVCGGCPLCAVGKAAELVTSLKDLPWERVLPVLEIFKVATAQRYDCYWDWIG